MKVALIIIAAEESEPYMDEWLQYNSKLGFENIYIYDNSCDNIFKKYANKLIRVIHFPVSPPQLKSYQKFLANYKHQYDCLFFSDIDEFLVLKQHKNISDFCKEFFAEPTTGAIAINWKMFGNNNHDMKPQGGVLSNFTRCNTSLNEHIKGIMRSSAVVSMDGVHYPVLKEGYYYKNIKGNTLIVPTYYNTSNDNDDDIVQLNHYYTRSTEEFLEKCNKLHVIGGAPKRQNFYDHLHCLYANEREDKFALNFLKLQDSILYNKNIFLLDISYSYNCFLKQILKYDIHIPLKIQHIKKINTSIQINDFYLIPLRNPVERFIEMFYRIKYDELMIYQNPGKDNTLVEFYKKFKTVNEFVAGIKQNENMVYKMLNNKIDFFNTTLSSIILPETVSLLNSENCYLFIDTALEHSYTQFCSKTNIEPNESFKDKLRVFSKFPYADKYEILSSADRVVLEQFLLKDMLIYRALVNKFSLNCG